MYDLIIIGAGPSGLSCAIEAKKRNLSAVVIDKGCIVNSIYHFPEEMVFFSTPDNLEIGSLPFTLTERRPGRLDALAYYREAVRFFDLEVKQYEEVIQIGGARDFSVFTRNGAGSTAEYSGSNLVVATGFFDNPNRIDAEGAGLPKVRYRFQSAHPYYDRDTAVIGGGNSAVEAAIELWRGGSRVTLIHRGREFSSGIKYWIVPDIRNRIEKKEITAFFESTVSAICETSIQVETPEGTRTIPNDFVFPLIGYRPPVSLLEQAGVPVDPVSGKPEYDPDTFATPVKGVYVCGALAAGNDANRIFIENGKLHGGPITDHIAKNS